jgi:hypothetical protein
MIRRQAGTRPGQKTGYPGESCRLDETGYDCIFDPHVVCLNRLKRMRLKASANRRLRAAILQPELGQRRSSVESISIKPASRTTMKLTNPLAHSSGRGPARNQSGAILPLTASCQGPLNAFEQLPFVEGLGQKTDRPGPHRPLPNPILGKCGNENHRRGVALSNQLFLQLDAAHNGHLDVGNKTGRIAQSRRQQELSRRSKRVGRKSH